MATNAQRQRQAEEELKPDRRADDLGKVGRKNPRFGQQPQADGDRERRMGAAGLRKIEPRADAEPRRERLQHDRHQAGENRDEEQGRAEFGAAGQRRRPIAGVHIAGGDEIARAQKDEDAFEEPVAVGNDDRSGAIRRASRAQNSP